MPGRSEPDPRAEIRARHIEVRARRAELLARHEENLPRVLRAFEEAFRKPEAPPPPLDEYVGLELARIDSDHRVAKLKIQDLWWVKYKARRKQMPLQSWNDGPYPRWRIEFDDEFKQRFREAEEDRLLAIQELEARVRLRKRKAAETASDNPGQPTETEHAKAEALKGTRVPFLWAKKAIEIHVETEAGRPTLAEEVPGLGTWGARLVLYWYGVGEPAGLWLDEDGELCWGKEIGASWERELEPGVIAPAPAYLHLPRPPKRMAT